MCQAIDIWDAMNLINSVLTTIDDKDKTIAEVQTELTSLRIEIKGFKEAALLRLIAINLEHEKKMKCITLLSPDQRQKSMQRDYPTNLDETKVTNAFLTDLEDLVPQSRWSEYRQFYSADEMSRDQDALLSYNKVDVIKGAFKALKSAFTCSALPTSQLDGSPATFESCVDLVQNSSLSNVQKREMLIQLRQLQKIRQNCPSDFLCS